jgi:hypothetical protein
MSEPNGVPTVKKKKKKWPWIIIAVVVIIIIIAAVNGGNSGGSSGNSPTVSNATDASAGSTAVSAATTNAKKPYSATLESGFYEVGVDIPAGTYDFEIASGTGNVVDIGDDINLMMGKGDSSYQKDYKNADLTDGNTLMVMQCSIKINSKAASTAIKKRDNSSAKATTLSSGKYTAGKDFQPGYYDISIVSGSGNVICQDNELNAMMGKDTSMYVKKYKNVHFDKDYKLDIEGPKVKLTPSK